MAQTFNNHSGSQQGDIAHSTSSIHSRCSRSEYATLCEAIGENITSIKNSSKHLEKLRKRIGKANDLFALQQQIHNINSETNERIDHTSRKLRRLQVLLRDGDRKQKLHLERLKDEFKHVLEKYSAHQLRNSRAWRQSYNVASVAERKASTTSNAELQQLQQLQRQEQAELDMLVERQRQVEQLEADIVDVNFIMTELSRLVGEQAEVVDRVEELVAETAVNVELGCVELESAVVARNSSRRRILILLLIAVIIVLIVAGIIVWKCI